MSSYFFRFPLFIFFTFGANQITGQSNDWENSQVVGFNTFPEKITAISLPDIESAQYIDIDRSNRIKSFTGICGINCSPLSKPREESRIYPDNYKNKHRINPVEVKRTIQKIT